MAIYNVKGGGKLILNDGVYTRTGYPTDSGAMQGKRKRDYLSAEASLDARFKLDPWEITVRLLKAIETVPGGVSRKTVREAFNLLKKSEEKSKYLFKELKDIYDGEGRPTVYSVSFGGHYAESPCVISIKRFKRGSPLERTIAKGMVKHRFLEAALKTGSEFLRYRRLDDACFDGLPILPDEELWARGSADLEIKLHDFGYIKPLLREELECLEQFLGDLSSKRKKLYKRTVKNLNKLMELNQTKKRYIRSETYEEDNKRKLQAMILVDYGIFDSV